MDGAAFIQDHMVQFAVFMDLAALQNQAIGQLGAFAHLDPPEQYAAFHLAFDHACLLYTSDAADD